MISNPERPIDLKAGAVLGRYELLLPIAKGGMAQVWAARLRGSRGFQKLVAIKTILPDVIDDTRMERMFLEEAQVAAQIHHPNVVGTLELGEQDGTLYLVMDWVDGEPLNQVMLKASAQGGMPLAIAVNLIGQACQGLFAAHELRDDNGELMGLVHRDVSPQNLLISFSGTAKLVDFGIAKATARSSGLTEAGEVKGKFAFMAPEQVRGHAVDCRTDLFALGIILYALSTGRHPFRGAHPGETLQNICSERPPALPSSFLSEYPPALEAVVMKSLSKQPDQRYASANQMLAALEEAMPGPLEASFEVEVATYLRELFGPRVSERRAAIRVAQEHADRQRADATSSSVGTLRAISIDQNDSGRFSVQTPEVTPISAPAELVGVRSAKPKLAAATALVGLLVTGLGLYWGGASAPATSAAASSPVPAEAPAQAAAAPELHETSPAPSASAEPAASASSKTERRPVRARVQAQAQARSSHAAASPSLASPEPTPEVAPSPPSPPPPAPAASPTPSANAWDRGAFGGRH
jgi:eukaryotic-like serine/threonine-protein kinase